MTRKLGGVHFITELAAGQYLTWNLQVIALQGTFPARYLELISPRPSGHQRPSGRNEKLAANHRALMLMQRFLRLELVDLLKDISKDTAAATEKPVAFLVSLNQAAYTYTPVLTSHTFENLCSSGVVRLILDESVQRIMFDYYGFDESQRQFRPLQSDTEFRHFELAAGVLDHEQEVFIQDKWRLINPDNIKAVHASELRASNVLDAAKRLQARPTLVAWLPYVWDMPLEKIGVHGGRLERAHAALEALNGHARKFVQSTKKTKEGQA